MGQVFLRGGLVALSLAALLAGCGPKGPGGPAGPRGPAPVGVMTVRAEPVALTVELTGRTSAYTVSEVRPQVSGVVRARLFTEGAYVRAGQPLYQIDDATYRASLQSASAGLAQAQASLTAAKLKADRYRALVANNTVSKQADDEAQASYLQASANVAAQQANVQQAKINLGYSQVRAPISGHIGKSSVTAGALVTNSQATPLATIQQLDKIYVDVSQSAADLLKLKRDLAAGTVDRAGSADVTLTLDDGTVYPIKGRLQFSDISVDPGTGSVGLRAVFANPDGVLLPGLFVRAKLSRGVAKAGILVPLLAVSRTPIGDASVFVIGPENKALPRPVTTGPTVGDKWLVTSGLKPGDQVIVSGLQNVRPGAAVKPMPLPATPPAPAR